MRAALVRFWGRQRLLRAPLPLTGTQALPPSGAPARCLGTKLSPAEVAHLPFPALPLACHDRNDAVFLHLAISSGADLLVSGDKDLTVLATAYPVASKSI